MKKTIFLQILPALLIFAGLRFLTAGENSSTEKQTVYFDSAQGLSTKEKLYLKIDNADEADSKIENYLRDLYPIISDKAVAEILASKTINKFLVNDTLGVIELYAVFFVSKYYLEDNPQILWELNIPEFQSRIYQIYQKDTVLIDTWRNAVGKPSTKTYTGHYQAFRIRNWPFWKDPESGDSVRPTPPGPNNPLGLFVVHYDENSLRYFHGTNKSELLKNEFRALSHGCVRNENSNIEKMKEFIIKKVIKSEDLSSWLGSKKSMIFDFKDEDKFPVRIIYKTFNVDKDEGGYYITFFRDIYNYSSGARLSKFDDPDLITFTSVETILNDIHSKFTSKTLSDDILIPALEKLISNRKYYQKYYLEDLLAQGNN